MRYLILLASASLLCGWSASDALGQQKHKGSPNSLATDVVYLKDKSVFYGIIHDATDSELTVVLERQWLKDNHPDFYKDHVEAEARIAQDAETELIKRIDAWIEERADDIDLKIFLDDEKEAARKRLADPNPESRRFTFVTLSKSDVRRVVLQPAPQRKIALVAWSHQLDDVAIRSANDLKRQLEKQKIEITEARVDFSDEIPGRVQSARAWALRKGIVEHVFCESLEFQGTGSQFFRRGEKVGMATLLSQLMGQGSLGGLGGFGGIQQLGEELGLPEFTRNREGQRKRQMERPAENNDWWKAQAAIAEKDGFRAFSITRLQQSLMSDKVSVDVLLVCQNDQQEWEVVGNFQGSARPSQQSDEDVKALMDDPQVKQISELADAFGLGASANLKKALQHGVATQSAMQDGLNQLAEFTDKFSRQLNGPDLGQ